MPNNELRLVVEKITSVSIAAMCGASDVQGRAGSGLLWRPSQSPPHSSPGLGLGGPDPQHLWPTAQYTWCKSCLYRVSQKTHQ